MFWEHDRFQAVFGWGLWLFPVHTSLSDGLHFPVRYSAEAQREHQLCVRPLSECSPTESAASTQPGKSTGPSGEPDAETS